jgi:predicted DNA-binding protein (MmcQ/YjbR family)
MDAESARAFLLKLPHAVETQQWGDNLVFWVGDKAIGGKMFCLLNLSGAGGVAMYAAGAERFAELVEREGLVPAPYMARIFWVAAERWGALRNAEWEEELRAAHALTQEKLPKRVHETLSLPMRAREMMIAERRKLLAARAAVEKSAKLAAKKTPKVKAKRKTAD